MIRLTLGELIGYFLVGLAYVLVIRFYRKPRGDK